MDKIELAYKQYWKYVKDSVDKEGWTYSNNVPHLLDAYFEHNTKDKIQFEKQYPGEYKGYRWRPISLKSK